MACPSLAARSTAPPRGGCSPTASRAPTGRRLTPPTGQILTPSGWTCYGQMGVYESDDGTKRSVTGLGCASSFGCPGRATVGTPNAQEDNLGVARCIPAHLASSGSARSARVLEPSRAFDVIARRARSSDLHWNDLVRNYGRALADKTWFVVLHPTRAPTAICSPSRWPAAPGCSWATTATSPASPFRHRPPRRAAEMRGRSDPGWTGGATLTEPIAG